jgi:endoglucanase
LFWSNGRFGHDRFYNADVVDSLVQDWGAGIVRAAMAVDNLKPDDPTPTEELGGYLTHPFDNEFNVKKVVNAAIENGIYVIIDWHAHLAEQNAAAAVEFYARMASIYGEYNNVIYEIYNEPVGTPWPQIKAYAQPVVDAIRAQDPDNLIIVGTESYSQRVDLVATQGGGPIADDANNIAYTLHFYAGTHGNELRANATAAMNAGLALFATEWGTVNADGAGQVSAQGTQDWMNFLRTNNISHCNWAISDQREGGASALVPGVSATGGWSDTELTQTGLTVRNIIRTW